MDHCDCPVPDSYQTLSDMTPPLYLTLLKYWKDSNWDWFKWQMFMTHCLCNYTVIMYNKYENKDQNFSPKREALLLN